MQAFANTTTMKPSVAEQRPAVPIPAPIEGAGKKLKAEFAALRARADVLETDRQHAALHRADFAKELEALADVPFDADASKGKAKTMRKAVAEESGVVDLEANRSIAFEATQIRDIGIGLLRKELALRTDLVGYLGRRISEGQKSIESSRSKLADARADVKAKLIGLGYLDPEVHKLDRSRVMPGMINDHPTVRTAAVELNVASELHREKSAAVNTREIETLRGLIQNEASKLAGLSVG